MRYLLIFCLFIFSALSSASCARYTTGGTRYSVNAIPFFSRKAVEYTNAEARRQAEEDANK